MNEFESLSLGKMLDKSAESVPDKTALIHEDHRISYLSLKEMTDSLAASLSDIGYCKGDRVAIYMKSSIEFVVAFYALQKIGVTVAWVNPMYRKSESRFILNNSGAKGVLIFREWEGYDYLDAVSDMKKDLPALESIVMVGKGSGDNVYSFYELLEKGKNTSFKAPEIDVKNDLSMLIYTSGTTGNPKGAMITHYGAVRGAYHYSLGVSAGQDDIFIGILPMTHSYGCGSILIQPFLLQSTLVLVETFTPEKAFEVIEKEKITLQLAAPAHYILELNNKNRPNYDLSSLRAGLIAGQPAPPGLITQVEQEMGVYLTSFWGASEVGPGLGILCPYPSPLEVREKYIGLPIEDTSVRIVNPETMEEVTDGEIGELTLSGWHVMKGYWNNPEETKKQIIDGWLFMGDLVSRDSDGYISVYGRSKDLINRGGYKIYPFELESHINEHPKILEACVVATPNPVLGENICVCVVLKGEEAITLEELKEFLKGKISDIKLPNELCIMDDFPRLSGGVKLKKFGKGGITEMAAMDTSREGYRG